MLVLTRKANQSIMIGDSIEISVLSVFGEKVRLGIDAPREVPVFRTEVFREIQGPSIDPRNAVDHAIYLVRSTSGPPSIALCRAIPTALVKTQAVASETGTAENAGARGARPQPQRM